MNRCRVVRETRNQCSKSCRSRTSKLYTLVPKRKYIYRKGLKLSQFASILYSYTSHIHNIKANWKSYSSPATLSAFTPGYSIYTYVGTLRLNAHIFKSLQFRHGLSLKIEIQFDRTRNHATESCMIFAHIC